MARKSYPSDVSDDAWAFVACPSRKPEAVHRRDFFRDHPHPGRADFWSSRRAMVRRSLIILPVFSALLAVGLFRSRASLCLEHLALRHQFAVYQQTIHRPRLRATDRLCWAWLSRLWSGWRTDTEKYGRFNGSEPPPARARSSSPSRSRMSMASSTVTKPSRRPWVSTTGAARASVVWMSRAARSRSAVARTGSMPGSIKASTGRSGSDSTRSRSCTAPRKPPSSRPSGTAGDQPRHSRRASHFSTSTIHKTLTATSSSRPHSRRPSGAVPKRRCIIGR